MQIIRLEADSFKRLRAVDITPRGDMVMITGRNAQGKSSVLDSIQAALAGGRACPADPIRHGQKGASIRLDLGDLVVTRKFTKDGSTLTVTNAEGGKISSPQAMLDAMLGQISFDPLAFSKAKPRDQFDQLKDVAKVDLDLEKMDQLNQADFARRTDLNREAKAARAQLEDLRLPAGDVGEPRDVAKLIAEVQEASQARMTSQRERDDRQRIQNRIDAKRAEVEALRQKHEVLRGEIAELKALLSADPSTPEPADYDASIETLNEAIRTAQAHNDAIRVGQDALRKKTELETLATTKETAAQGLTESMAARQEAKEKALAGAKFPVPGLGLGEGIVTYNGVPLSQASSAEQLRISTALAMAANPKLKVVLIREGSLLDEQGLHLVAELAREKGYQVWMESVSNRKDVGVVIEDGQVSADNQEDEEGRATA